MSVAVRALAVLMRRSCWRAAPPRRPPARTRPPRNGCRRQAGTDVGNDRPQVTYDGLMVRRRVVIAIHPTPAPTSPRCASSSTSRRPAGTRACPPSPQRARPGDSRAPGPGPGRGPPRRRDPCGRREADRSAFAGMAGIVNRVQEYDVASVLVHDLRFSVATATRPPWPGPSRGRASCRTRSGTTRRPSAAVSSTSPTPGPCSATTWSSPSVAASHAPRASRRRRSPSRLAPRPDLAWTWPGSRHRHPSHPGGHGPPARSSPSNCGRILTLESLGHRCSCSVSLVGLTLVIRMTTRINRPDEH